jgi:hypothetical protein
MAKTILAAALDACYEYIQGKVTMITVCTTQPTTYAQANATYMLAKQAVTSTCFTIGAGTGSGRKVTTQAKSGVTVATTGTAKFIAWAGSTASALLLVTTCTSVALTTGNTVTIPAHVHEFGDLT